MIPGVMESERCWSKSTFAFCDIGYILLEYFTAFVWLYTLAEPTMRLPAFPKFESDPDMTRITLQSTAGPEIVMDS